MRDVAVNLGLLGEDGRTRPVVQTYVDTQHAAQPYVKVSKGERAGDRRREGWYILIPPPPSLRHCLCRCVSGPRASCRPRAARTPASGAAT